MSNFYTMPTPLQPQGHRGRLSIASWRDELVAHHAQRSRKTILPSGPGLYFFQPEGTDVIKIGRTDDLARRFSGIQGGNHLKLSVRAFWPAPPMSTHESKTLLAELEQALHRRFRPKRIRGEWFQLDDDVSKLITWINAIGPDRIRNLDFEAEFEEIAGLVGITIVAAMRSHRARMLKIERQKRLGLPSS